MECQRIEDASEKAMDCANDGTLIKLELRGLLEEESFETAPLIS